MTTPAGEDDADGLLDGLRAVQDEVEVIIQVNGKLRDRMTVARDLDEANLERIALASTRVQESLSGKSVRKVVVVPNKIVNLVAR